MALWRRELRHGARVLVFRFSDLVSAVSAHIAARSSRRRLLKVLHSRFASPLSVSMMRSFSTPGRETRVAKSNFEEADLGLAPLAQKGGPRVQGLSSHRLRRRVLLSHWYTM